MPVLHLESAAAWYTMVFEPGEAIDPVRSIREFEVIPGCWIQLLEGEPAGGAWTLRYGVLDIDRERSRLLDLGVEVGNVRRIEGVIAFADFADPFGNRLSAYQVL